MDVKALLILVLAILSMDSFAQENSVEEGSAHQVAATQADLQYLYIQSKACELPGFQTGFLKYSYDPECLTEHRASINRACKADSKGLFNEFCKASES